MISICMPYYDRQERLNDALLKYDEIYKDFDLEIVIVDDGSPEPIEVETSFPHTILTLPKTGPLNPCVPINLAVAQAGGSRVLLTSPEVIHRTDVLSQMIAEWDTNLDYVSASVFDHERGYLTGDAPRQKGSRAPYPEGAEFPHCALFSKELFIAAGGYDPDYRRGRAFNDNDFLWRFHYAGARFKTVTGIVYHVHEKTRWELPSNEPLFRKKWPELYSS
jgi:glycosyltransferase involved in cell wall biosynthesis